MNHPEDPNPDNDPDKVQALPPLPEDLSAVPNELLAALWEALPHIITTFVRHSQLDDAHAAVKQQDRLIAFAKQQMEGEGGGEACGCPACTASAEEQATAAIAVASGKCKIRRAPDGSFLN